jgi:hypothetical protein
MNKNLLRYFLTGVACVLLGLCGHVGFAQQNLFNIPSATITPAKGFFYQHQLNIYKLDNYASKHHFVYGLGKNWEIGFNIININIVPNRHATWFPINTTNREEPFSPLGMLTAQKQIDFGELWQLNIGTQVGTNLLRGSLGDRRFTSFNYSLLSYKTHKHWHFMAGAYVSDEEFMGKGSNVGVIAGFEIPVNSRWLVMGDFISGNTKNSVSVLGFTYNVTPHFQVCLGGLLPNPASKEKYGIVAEINLFNF